MTLASTRTPGLQDSAQSVRLDSWKEIAAYLGKVERTVKRWESERALPVHRPPGGKGSVYAYTAELDQWLKSAKAADSEEPYAGNLSGESEGGGEAVGLMASQPPAESAPERLDPRAASPARKRFAWSWRIPIFALLPVLLILTADFLVHRRPDAHASSIPTPQLSKPASGPFPPTAPDAEKRIAHDLYLQGRFEWNKRTADSLNRALDLFTQAIVHDPSSAQTYTGLAETYMLMHEFALMPTREAYGRAIAAARKAVELDDSLSEAHRALAFAEVWGNWDFQTGEKEFRRAIELDPRDPQAHLWFATAFDTPGWYPITLHEFDRAQELDPASPVILANKSIWLFENGQKEAGLELARQVERTNPDFLAPHRYLSQMDWNLRNYPDFLIESEKTASLNHDAVLMQTTAAAREGFRRDGELGLVHDLYLAQKKLYTEGKLAGGPLERTCIRLGKKEEALQLLQDDYDRHRAEFLWSLSDLDLRTLKDEPRYQELIRKLHFPTPPAITEMDPAAKDSNPAVQNSQKHS